MNKVPPASGNLTCPACHTRISAGGDRTLPHECPACGASLLPPAAAGEKPGSSTRAFPVLNPQPAEPELPPAPSGFEVLEILGRGGMGTVAKGRRLSDGRLLALKYLHLTTGGLRERFLREGRVSTQLVHPNIVQGLGIEFVDDTPVLLFEYVQGIDMRALVERDGPLPVPRAVGLVKQLLAGLGCAHQAGVVHRDLKSANVLVTVGDVAKLGDFGTARIREAHEQLTKTGMLMGTPSYMAPEQARGEQVDARADIYAAGVILFELLTGTVPFKAPSPMALIMKIGTDDPPLASELVPQIPAHLAEVVDRCLKKHPEQRPPTAEALIAALEAVPGARRTARTLKNIPVLADAPVSGATIDGGAAVGTLDGAAVNRTQDGAPARPRNTGRVRPLSRSSASIAVVAPPPPSRMPVVLAAVGGAALMALVVVGVQWMRPARPPALEPRHAIAQPITVLNAKDSTFVTRVDGQLALAFEVEPKQPLRATLVHPTGEADLTRWDEKSTPARQVFKAPPEHCLEPFSVRLRREDFQPVTGGTVDHPGLMRIVKDWHPKLAAPEGAELGPERWAVALDRLAAAIGAQVGKDAFRNLAAGARRNDVEKARPLLNPTALRARVVLEPVLAAIGAVMEAPLAEATLEEKKLAHDALMPVRLLDRALVSAKMDDMVLGAESALGPRFKTGDSVQPSEVAVVANVKSSITSRGFLEEAGARDALMLIGKAPPTTVESKTVVVRATRISRQPDALARLDVECKQWQGETDALPRDELLFVELEDARWTLLIHAGAILDDKTGDGRPQFRRFAHAFDPSLLADRMKLKFSREVLPSTAKDDRRVIAAFISKLTLRVGPPNPEATSPAEAAP